MIEYYKGDYKYLLKTLVEYDTGICNKSYTNHYLTLTATGHLTIKEGYAWDGPSGPTFHTKSFMRGSLIHDALYQILRSPAFNLTENDHIILRHRVDLLLHDICLEDGMWKLRAKWVLHGVRAGGGPAAAVKVRRVYTAP